MTSLNVKNAYSTDRYLIDFDLAEIPVEYHDVLIIGSGIAGVYTALTCPRQADILIITKDKIEISNSTLAQGGIAVSLDKKDSPDLHFRDTTYAGAGLCDEQTVRVLVNEATENIATLCLYGVNFDRDEDKRLSLTREAAHSMNRIIHTGDATGKEVCDTLVGAVNDLDNVQIRERTYAIDLLTQDGVSKGVLVCDEETGATKAIIAPVVICASGGYGRLYASTTNPEVATGDGASIAFRAGAELMDLEFVQFHPTVLYHKDNKSFLISEAVRGEGAILLNSKGERFMPAYHAMAELAPRDIVSRAIFQEMQKTGDTHLFLDITHKGKDFLEQRFPTIYKTCLSYGIDMAKEFIPVAPSQHYSMGGIKTDEWGRTGIPGFYAVGEAACNGIHGANRLASNSLLEGLVFGRRISRQITENLADVKQQYGKLPDIRFQGSFSKKSTDAGSMIADLQDLMILNVGILRNEEGLQQARQQVRDMASAAEGAVCTCSKVMELKNMLMLSSFVIEAALLRQESRGAHYRTDYPNTDDKKWLANIIFSGGK